MEYGHSWTNLRERARNIYIYIYIYIYIFEKKRQRKKLGDLKCEYNRREKDFQVYVYSVCHMRSLIDSK